MDIQILIVIAVLATVLGITLGRYVWPAIRGIDPQVLASTEMEVARLNERVAGFMKQVDEQARQISALETQRDAAAEQLRVTAVDVARLKERETGLQEKIATQVVQLTDLQRQLTAEFENIANRILKANATELSEHSQKAFATILDPLRERIQDFQKKVESTYEAETREVL